MPVAPVIACYPPGAMVYLTQLIYVHAGREAGFEEFEAIVLPLLARYRGELMLRLRPDAAAHVGGSLAPPYEVHLVRFESEADLERYTNDPERQRAIRLKDESVRETILVKAVVP